MFIFIDDERNPEDVTWVKMPKIKKEDWIVVRSYNEFVKLLEDSKESPTFVSFDHDLADQHYKAAVEGTAEVPKTFSEKTGNSCAKALIVICMDKHWRLPGVQVHSMNPVGKENIVQTLVQGSKWVEEACKKGVSPQGDGVTVERKR